MPGRGGKQRLITTCPTESAVFFEHAVLDDGRILVTEFPDVTEDGMVRGGYRLTVLR